MKAYLFDIDGVITNPQTRKVEHPELISHIVSRLQNGDPVGLISGRALSWIKEKVVDLLLKHIAEHPDLQRTILDNLFIAGEFGGAFVTHSAGKPQVILKKDLMISESLRASLKDIGQMFGQYAFIDEDKQTQFSMEMNYGGDEEQFRQQAKEITAQFRDSIGDDPTTEAHFDRIGINVKNKKLNKQYATEEFLEWLRSKKYAPQKFYAFGDSISDLEIGKELFEHDLPMEFIFVGEQELVKDKKLPFSVTFTQGLCDEGTLEFLQKRERLPL